MIKAGKLFWDPSKTNTLAYPKSEQDIRKCFEVWLKMIKNLKEEKAPSGVVLNESEIHAKSGQYRENIEYERTKEVLGRGNSAGEIYVIEDNFTGAKHAQKTVLISHFRPEEIEAWVDLNLNKLQAIPELRHFQLEGNKVVIHMEVLENAITVRDIFENRVGDLIQTNAALLLPFSIYVFHILLEVVHTMHEIGWTHRDLHSKNVLIQKKAETLVIRVVDLGSACKTNSEDGQKGIRSDVLNALRIFSALFLGEEFHSQKDLEDNWRTKLFQRMIEQDIDSDKRTDIFSIFPQAGNTAALRQIVKEMTERESVADQMKEATEILFPEKSDLNLYEKACSDLISSESVSILLD
ncbi:citron rho-interacting kinase-like [Crassostrea angulata]|uniref:citron rho-interacting kinase-like n=1 Tax=Magallana angulata TaxID=2784310 RepID=UPI0022B17C25|nr:citron rho-interacting kinase-like [Crassostrea angulata]